MVFTETKAILPDVLLQAIIHRRDVLKFSHFLYTFSCSLTQIRLSYSYL